MRDVSTQERSFGARVRRARDVPSAPLPRQLAVGELLERIRELPSRAHMVRPKPQANLAEGLARFYLALWRHAYARHTARYRLTWSQMLAANGYEPIAYGRRHTSMWRYARLLEEAGLVRISGRDELADGRTCVVTLLEPPARLESAEGRRSSAGRALHS